MTLQIVLSPQAEAWLRKHAEERGQESTEYLQELVEQQVRLDALQALKSRQRPVSLNELKPRIPSPTGTSWLSQVAGQWPGDETDEQIYHALEELS